MGFWTPWRGARRRDKAMTTSMSLTSAQGPATASVSGVRQPAAVTQERMKGWLTQNGFHFFIDSDEDLGGIWDSRVFFFLLMGDESEILQIRSQWNREVTIERIDEVLSFCNEWNTERIWPKAYVRVRDNGMIQTCAEMSVDLEKGVTDAQLGIQLGCGLNSQTVFWNALDELYPDPAVSAA